MKRLFRHNLTFILMLGVVAGWFTATLWPPSYWLDVDEVIVFDGPAESDVFMRVDRDIRRPFHAQWDVLVRELATGGSTVVCAARGHGDYRVDAVLPDPLTLDWWTEGQCPTLPPGEYFISTVWVIEGGSLPDKLVRSESNVFRITEVEP